MKKNNKNFYYSYAGGKSKELKYIDKYFDLLKFDTIIEPFCGSCSFSYNCFKKDSSKKYVINDIDTKLVGILNDIKINTSKKYFDFCKLNYTKDTTKEHYNNIVKQDSLESHFYKSKIYTLRQGLMPIKYINFDLEHENYKKLDSFFMSNNVEINNVDYKDIIEQYKNDDRAFIFLDPPYFLSCNQFYATKGKGFEGCDISKKEYIDPTAEYIYIRNALQHYKCKIIMIINDCELLRDYFRDFYKESYDKTYQITKKKSKHMVVSNIINKVY